MPQITVSTIVKLVIASIIVGAVMAFFNWQPMDVYEWVAAQIGHIFRNIQHYTGAAISYFLLGAVVVVPIWLIMYLLKATGKKS